MSTLGCRADGTTSATPSLLAAFGDRNMPSLNPAESWFRCRSRCGLAPKWLFAKAGCPRHSNWGTRRSPTTSGRARERSQLFTLEFLARVLAASGRGQEAARLFGACESFRAERGIIRHVAVPSALLDASGAAADSEAVEEGRSLTLHQAADYARRFRATQVIATSGWDALTPTKHKSRRSRRRRPLQPRRRQAVADVTRNREAHLSRASPNSTSTTAKNSSSPPPAAECRLPLTASGNLLGSASV